MVSGAIGKKRHLDRKELISVCAILILFFILFNLLNFSQKRWTLHPDDHDIYIFSKVLVETGHLWYTSPLNEVFKTQAFQPPLSEYESGTRSEFAISAAYPPGIYFLCAPGHILGLRGPFAIIAACGVLGILFLFLLVRNLFGKEQALFSCALLGFSAPYIYWSNMLFSNIPAVSFFLGGLFFLSRFLKQKKSVFDAIASIILFAMSVWIRYEFVIFVAIVLLIALIARIRVINKKAVLSAIIIVLLLGALFLVANLLSTGSTRGVPEKVGAGKQPFSKAAGQFLAKPDAAALVRNFKDYIFLMAPVILILGLVGVFITLKKNTSPIVISLIVLSILVFYAYGKSPNFYAYGKYWLSSSYTRYFLPLFAGFSILGSEAAISLLKVRRWKRVTTLLLLLALSAHVAISGFILYKNGYGLKFTYEYSKPRKALNNYLETLPRNSVIVDLSNDDYFRFDITSRTVLNPSYFKSEGREEKLFSVIGELAKKGYPVFFINNPERSLLDPEAFDARFPQVELVKMPHPVVFTTGSRTPDIYRVSVRSG